MKRLLIYNSARWVIRGISKVIIKNMGNCETACQPCTEGQNQFLCYVSRLPFLTGYRITVKPALITGRTSATREVLRTRKCSTQYPIIRIYPPPP
jgi:hypothetical protein